MDDLGEHWEDCLRNNQMGQGSPSGLILRERNYFLRGLHNNKLISSKIEQKSLLDVLELFGTIGHVAMKLLKNKLQWINLKLISM